jgi:hypothetical protein
MSTPELSTGQVAERFNVITDTVRKWCRRGLFPRAREMDTPRGPVWMIPESDLKGFEPPKITGRPKRIGTGKRATGTASAGNSGSKGKKKGGKR